MRRADENRGDWKEWRRLRAWELWQAGWQQQEIAEVLGASEGAVSQWITIGREQGEEGLRGKVAEGPACRLNAEQEAQLPALLDQGAEAHGFRGNVWTTERVAAIIEKQFGVKYHPAHMSRLLRRIKYSLQKPVEKASQRNEEAIAAWKDQHWPALKKKLRKRDEPSCL
jgi:transposase